jgi:NAD(P)H-flavin reductase
MGGQEAVNTERNLIKMSAMPGNGTNQLPLMMKKYDAGKLTQKLFSKYRNCHLNVSTPMGRGLCLDKIRKGRVVIIVGGTGIYPFVDLIDLLFKFTVLQKQLAPPNDMYESFLK